MSLNDKREELERKAHAYVGKDSGIEVGPDPVNEVMIRQLCEVINDQNPVYVDDAAAKANGFDGIITPPAALQMWTMPGARPPWDLTDEEKEIVGNRQSISKDVELNALFAEYGYTGVVGTDQEEEYIRPVRPGEKITAHLFIDHISEQKATALGLGYFITVRRVYKNQDGEEVATSTFRVLRYQAPAQPAAQAADAPQASAKPKRLKPPMGHDNSWWWDAVENDQFLIQSCKSCNTLRHPPRPMCGKCQSLDWEGVEASGNGTIYSYTVMHHPKFPGFDYPFVTAVIELEEGTRIVSNVVDCDPLAVHVGMPVELTIQKPDGELKLPLFRPVA